MTRITVPPAELERQLAGRLAALDHSSTRRPRRRRKAAGRARVRFAALSALGALMLVFVGATFAVHDEGFQLEGNVEASDLSFTDIDPGGGGGTLTPGTLQDEFAGDFDWDSLFAADTSEIDQTANGFVDQDFVVDYRIGAGPSFDTSDPSTFTGGGSKDINEISQWRCVEAANVTNKGDIINAYAAIYEDGDDRILYFGIEKQEGNGDNNVGLWLFQDGNVGCEEGGSGNGNPFSGAHVPGDLLLVAENTNGGGIASIIAYEWVADLDGNPANGLQPGLDDDNPVASGADCLDISGGDEICATTNGKNINVPWPHAGAVNTVNGLGGLYEKVSFIEGGINLSEFEEFADTCFTGFLFNTRASQETTSSLFDYALGDIDTCHPELDLEKTPDSGTHFQGDSFDWTIEVNNTGDGDADDAVVTDTIPDGLTINSATTAAGSCDIDGQDVECTIDVPAGGSATITINVTATAGVFEDDEGCVTLNNEATVSVDGDTDASDDSDEGSVDVCRIFVSKDATTTFTRTHEWDIDKSVVPDAWGLFTGESGTSEYTVDVTKTGFTDSDWAVSGTITIDNPAPIAAPLTGVTDEVSPDIAALVDCSGATSVPAEDSITCTYSASLPNGNNRTNTATATLQNSPSGTTDFSGSADVTFGDPTTEVDATVTVDDTFAGDLGSFSDTGSTSYTRTFECDDDEGTHDNTATINETDQSDDASVTVTCYTISVEKDADTSFTRTWDWTIDKVAHDGIGEPPTQITMLDLNPDQTFLVTYEVTVDASSTDSDWAVEGEITITNPHPTRAAELTAVTDTISPAIAATVDCGGATEVPADDSLVCTYDADLPDATNRTNTATATQQLYDFDEDLIATPAGTSDHTGMADVTFGATPTDEVDECIDVTDTNAVTDINPTGFLGTVCATDTLPFTFSYDVLLGPFDDPEECGEVLVPNTAAFETNDTEATGSADWLITITVHCPEGCTLTQGYWKTHSAFGPAPEDATWLLLPDVDGDGTQEGPDEDFFLSGQTWYEVFWTAPKGNAYYNLAHQYMAAVLNGVAGADTSEVDDEIAAAEALFETYTPAAIGALKGQKAPRPLFISLAGTLASYNEGDIGPGHCDEDRLSASS